MPPSDPADYPAPGPGPGPGAAERGAAERVQPTAHNLRGIAHPVRVRLLGLLRVEGPATATMLAQRLGLNTGATSYHLRQLAAHGFVVEDASRGTSRERWWQAAHRSTYLDRALLDDDESGAASEFLRSVAEMYADRMFRAIDELPATPPAWRQASAWSDYQLQLTPDELRRVVEEVTAVLARHPVASPAGAEPPPDTATVSFQFQAFRLPGTVQEPDR